MPRSAVKPDSVTGPRPFDCTVLSAVEIPREGLALHVDLECGALRVSDRIVLAGRSGHIETTVASILSPVGLQPSLAATSC